MRLIKRKLYKVTYRAFGVRETIVAAYSQVHAIWKFYKKEYGANYDIIAIEEI